MNDRTIKRIEKELNRITVGIQGAVNITDLFPSKFIQEHTNGRFTNARAFFMKSELKIKSQIDLDLLNEEKLDMFIAQNTDFKSWNEMFRCAALIIARDRIGGKPHIAKTGYKDPFCNILFPLEFHVK